MVTVFVDGAEFGTAMTDATGSWSFTQTIPLFDGPHTIKARATDRAGNTSADSANSSFTVDSSPPDAPVVAAPANGLCANDSTPTYSGTAEPHSTVTVIVDGHSVGTATASGSGTWSFTQPTPIIEGAHAVKARARDVAGNTSADSATSTFIVDTSPPAAPVVTAPTNGSRTNDSTPTYSGTAEALSTVTLFVDGVSIGTTIADATGIWSFPQPMPFPDGPHSVNARATDCAGNSTDSATSTFIVDTSPPAAPVVVAPANNSRTNDSTPTYSGTAEPNSTVTVIVDGSDVGTAHTNASGTWSLTQPAPLFNAVHAVKARARDVAGNTSADSSTHSFTVDTSPPAAPVVVAPANNSRTNDNSPTYAGTAEAGSTVTVTVDGSDVGTATASGSGTWSFTPTVAISDGPHAVKARARDGAGNTSTDSTTSTFIVDTGAPAAPVVTAPVDGWCTNDNTPTYAGTAEAGSTVTVTVDGSDVGTATADFSGNWSLTPSMAITDGAHTVKSRASDGAGNTSTGSATISFTVDTTPPAAPVVVVPANGSITNTSTPNYSGTAEVGSTVTVTVDDLSIGTAIADATGNWNLTQPVALSPGTHIIKAGARDMAGNNSTDSISHEFTVDATPPGAPVVEAPAHGSFTNNPTPNYSGTAEAGSTITLIVDDLSIGTAITNVSGSWNLTQPVALSEGAHTVEARATDGAGNIISASSTVSFTVDTVAPSMPVLIAPAAFVNTATPTIAGAAEPGSIVTVSLDNQVVGAATASMEGTWNFTPEAALAEGSHAVTVTTTDAAGNTSLASSHQTFVVDTIAPAAPVVTSPAAGDVHDVKNSLVTGTAEAGTTVTVILDGEEVGTEEVSITGSWSFTPAEDFSEGTHTLAARSIDAAGNQGPLSASTPFTIVTRGHYGGCASAPTFPAGWVAVALGAGWLFRRERRQRVQLLLVLVLLNSGNAFGASAAQTPYPGKRNPHFKEVARSYDSLRYERALAAVQKARVASGNSAQEMLWLDLMEGVLHYELENEKAAAEAFTRAMAQSRQAQIPVPNPSPELLNFFESVRKSTQAPLPVPTPSPALPRIEATPPPAGPKPPAALEKDSGSLVANQPEPSAPGMDIEPYQSSSALAFMVGLRSEAELLKRGITPSLTAELSSGPDAGQPGVRLGAALTALLRPMGMRAEGRLYPYDLGSSGEWRIRPYLAVGTTYVLSSRALAGRGSVGAALQFGRFQLFADAAYERFFTSDGIYHYEPQAVLFSLGAGWRLSSRR